MTLSTRGRLPPAEGVGAEPRQDTAARSLAEETAWRFPES